MEKERLIDVEQIVKVYHGRKVVDKISLNVHGGEIVGLLGPNGAGKTTTFYMVVGLVKPDGGKVRYAGSDITALPMHTRARMGVGYLPQEPSVFRKLTVRENVMAVLETLDLDRQTRERRCDELLADLGLDGLAGQKALTLSGGERRKLEITRALARDPAVIMLDEPFSGVDPLAVEEIQKIALSLRGRGLGVMITDHNVRETLSVVDRAYLIYEGKVLREGESSFLINDETSRRLYLGMEFKA
ncbi:MAG: LPS export ABC transporter ATP-binding protein [Kiritimatiellia bacterium]